MCLASQVTLLRPFWLDSVSCQTHTRQVDVKGKGDSSFIGWSITAILSNVSSIVNTSNRNHAIDTASERFGKRATSVTYSAPNHSYPPTQEYVGTYYSDTIREVWGKLTPLPASLLPHSVASWNFTTKSLISFYWYSNSRKYARKF